jgi:leucyl/phenylalanyl-tRNA--protein transferase
MLKWLERDDPFPPAEAALRDPNGLLCAGADLSLERLLAAYRRGIFPWYSGDEPVLWWSPDPRAIIELDHLYVSRRLARRIRSGQSAVTCDRDFAGVVAGCAEPRERNTGTWITPSFLEAYCRLHELGHAHRVAVWHAGQLVGGVYGVALGGLFAGESMFHRRTDASKVALTALVGMLRAGGFRLLDVQFLTPFLAQFGAVEIPRADYLERLAQARAAAGRFPAGS